MKTTTKTTLAAAAAALALGTYAGSLAAQGHEGHGEMSAGSKALHESMAKGHGKMMSMKMTGDADHDFAMMMAEHHRGGIEMAEIELKHGKDVKMKEMARKIMEGQKKEIAEFEAWMKTHKPAAAGHAH